MTYEEARRVVLERVRNREANFLRTLERGVFGNPRSPYFRMLELARCEPGDLRQMVAREGLEPTLRTLRAAGVYVSFDEFKGQTPIIRGGEVIEARPRDFDNPSAGAYYQVTTGGSTGTGRRVLMDLGALTARLPVRVLAGHHHGTADLPTIRWVDIPPSIGLNVIMGDWVCGTPTARWFTAVWGGDDGTSRRFRWATQAALATARLSGAWLPRPERVPLDQPERIAAAVHALLRRHGRCQVQASVSRLLRIAVAARELGYDLTNVIMHGGGEPPTPAKVARITSTGARFLSSYHFVEGGAVGHGCTDATSPNDQHFMKDHLALIQAPRPVPGFDLEVPSFCFTTLLDSAPKLLLNVEIDDYGVLENRPCNCPWGQLGFTDHIVDIRSYRKLTGEGVTLVGGDIERILEEVLPARFGGSALDYQLLEEEDATGFTRLVLLVNPSVHLPDDAAAIAAFLEAMDRIGAGGHTSRVKWRQAGTLQVRREPARLTARGKLMPLHLARHAATSTPKGVAA